jgi:hypothetical protein
MSLDKMESFVVIENSGQVTDSFPRFNKRCVRDLVFAAILGLIAFGLFMLLSWKFGMI